MITSIFQTPKRALSFAKRRLYSPTALHCAYKSVVEDRWSILKAAKQYGVPRATLQDRISGRISIDTCTVGPAPLLSCEEEAILVDHLKAMAGYGYGYTRLEVVDLATEYAIRLGKRTVKQPLTLQWFRKFQRRWPEIRVLKPRALEQCRAKAASADVVDRYFDELQKILQKYDLTNKPHRIFNVDEKGFSENHTPPSIVAAGDSVPQAVTSGKSTTTTVLGCGNAAGMSLPPFFVFAGKRMLPELLQGSAPGAVGTVSDSGWSNSAIFGQFLSDHFLQFVPVDDGKPVILMMDGHKSHISIGLVEWAQERNIVLFILPAHTSHILQPLDVGCFGPLQVIYDNLCHKFMRDNHSTITRYNVCALASNAYTKAMTPENLQKAFSKTGIFPLNKSCIPPELLKPSEVFIPESECDDPDDDVMDVSVTVCADSSSSADVFHKRLATLKNVKSKAKSVTRKSVSRVVSGHAITEPEVSEALRTYTDNTTKSHRANKKQCSATRKVPQTKSPDGTVIVKAQQSKRRITKARPSEPIPGPSHINLLNDSDSSESQMMMMTRSAVFATDSPLMQFAILCP